MTCPLRPGQREIAGVRPSNLFDVAGKPFGWAHAEERRMIRDHLLRRGWTADDMGLYFRISRIQQRLHKYDLPFRELQRLYALARPVVVPTGAPVDFTWEELARLVEHFAGANDPVTASIAAKAQLALDKRSDK